jgi:hypothetical protein
MQTRSSSKNLADFEGAESFLTFRELSGYAVGRDEVIEEIKRLPLDGVLGFLANLSLQMIQSQLDFHHSSLQGGYLNLALVDDFPRKIASAHERYIPGRAPITGRHHTFVHEQNMAWLCHSALLNSKQNVSTPELTYHLRCRLFRLLLIINDLLNKEKADGPFDLERRRIFVHNWLRHGQFNRFFGNSTVTLSKLARQNTVMCDILPKYFPDLHSMFIDAKGVSLQRYFEVMALLLTHFHGGMRPGSHWLARKTIMSGVKANRADIQMILNDWSVTPEAYRTACQAWRSQRRDQGELPLYDYVPLRERPLVEARPGELVCAVPAFVFAKVEDEPFFILSDFLTGTELNRFHTALGSAYEEYANGLIERIACSDKSGKWSLTPGPTTRKGEQLADIYLQRGETGIVFEHKGQRPGTEFLRGGEGDRVVGPSAEFIRRLEDQGTVDLKEGYSNDKGLMTRGMWQQSKAGGKLVSWAEQHIGEKPLRLFPIITLYCSLITDTVVKKAYLTPLIEKACLYSESYWKGPQWLNVSDLESLATMAEDGKLDLEDLLNEKCATFDDRRFDFFLYEKKARYIDKKLVDKGRSILDSAALAFFEKRLARSNGEPHSQ